MGAMSIITLGVVGYIHLSQTAERQRMRQGVIADLQRMKGKQEEMARESNSAV